MPPILLVDDDPDIRESVRDVLEEEGYRVCSATNGAEALRCLTQVPRPCLAIVDLMMPVMDGRELIERLRRDDRLADLPILVMTAHTNQIDGLTDPPPIMRKPFRMEQLLSSVARWCEGSGDRAKET